MPVGDRKTTIGRGEQAALTSVPHQSALLPLRHCHTVPDARQSAADLWACFEAFSAQGDFVGMVMARKFIQMNHAGGRKYRKGTRDNLTRS